MFRYICLAIVYLNVGNYAWRPLYTKFENNIRLKLSKTIEEPENNSTNYNFTFMDHDEYMMIIHFSRQF